MGHLDTHTELPTDIEENLVMGTWQDIRHLDTHTEIPTDTEENLVMET